MKSKGGKGKDWDSIVNQIDSHIKEGNIKVASDILKSLSPQDIKRDYKVLFAKLAQRCDMFSWGMKLLFPYIKQELNGIQKAQDEEKLIYASLLIRSGLFEEGLLLLHSITSHLFPEKQLYTAHAHVLSWNLQEAIKCYLNYLKYNGLTDYQILVSNLNLGSCYIDVFEFEEDFFHKYLSSFYIYLQSLLSLKI